MATLAPSQQSARSSDVVGIMLVDDHAIVRQGLRSILEREDDLRVVAEASSASEALAVVGRANPQIVLLDLKLSTSSDSEGLELCQELTRSTPSSACWCSPPSSTSTWCSGHPRRRARVRRQGRRHLRADPRHPRRVPRRRARSTRAAPRRWSAA